MSEAKKINWPRYDNRAHRSQCCPTTSHNAAQTSTAITTTPGDRQVDKLLVHAAKLSMRMTSRAKRQTETSFNVTPSTKSWPGSGGRGHGCSAPCWPSGDRTGEAKARRSTAVAHPQQDVPAARPDLRPALAWVVSGVTQPRAAPSCL
ncbi:hypothetical protein SKAU_G00088300 [Synaphobranchus kaupii]|uniref:Uncharacterized protein n=1 Tax=Synaphobranchus kaupii TaxID=118154 RepID=A0A9Q1FWC1_SYNKA|nr:hypothetical protein SKAU_G00088300 [Synaphobranchus kaupii]